MDERIQNEKIFHNERFEEDTRRHLDKYYSVARTSLDFYKGAITSYVKGKKILEFGCGEGSFAFIIAVLGGFVYGIDISDVAIKKASDTALKNGVDKNVDFRVMNAEELTFNNDFFDEICGSAILHHLDLEKALSELCRVLKKDGKAVFLEPLGHNFLINLYRKLTPGLRTVDEHPLLKEDLRIFSQFFDKIEIHYFHLCTLAAIPFRRFFFFGGLLKTLELLDRFLFKFKFFRLNAWQVVIELSRPKK